MGICVFGASIINHFVFIFGNFLMVQESSPRQEGSESLATMQKIQTFPRKCGDTIC